MCGIHFRKLLWVYYLGHSGIKGTDRADWLENQPSQMVYVSEDPKCWGTRDTALGHKAKDIFTVWIALRREAWKAEVFDDLHRKDKRGPLSIRRTLELFQRQRWKISERRDEAHSCELFRACRYHLELNWTELCQSSLVKWRALAETHSLFTQSWEVRRSSRSDPLSTKPCSAWGLVDTILCQVSHRRRGYFVETIPCQANHEQRKCPSIQYSVS